MSARASEAWFCTEQRCARDEAGKEHQGWAARILRCLLPFLAASPFQESHRPEPHWGNITHASLQVNGHGGAAIVAADFPGIGRPSDDRFEVKRILHAAGVMMVEQLCNLGAVAGRSWHLFAGPLRVRGTAGSIIRACAQVERRAYDGRSPRLWIGRQGG
jgi:hypothetical protein